MWESSRRSKCTRTRMLVVLHRILNVDVLSKYGLDAPCQVFWGLAEVCGQLDDAVRLTFVETFRVSL